jgi:farnesyl-diphosphate farnesyltransferase
LRRRILGEDAARLDFGLLARGCSFPAEKVLLQRVEEALGLLQELSEADRRLVREVLRVITSGQVLDLQRFSGGSEQSIIALETDAELDDYTYRVAGCVGEFWTRLCRAHLFPSAPLDENLLLNNGVRFGKGLQLVNILRDLPRDLRQGRCYVPRQVLATAGLTPSDLLSPENRARFQPLYETLLDRAEAHLAAGWDYTNTLPFGQFRLRLGCAWPILIGVRTLGRLRHENILDPARPIKVSRGELYALIAGSVVRVPFPGAWRRQFVRAMKDRCNCK